MLFYRKSIHTLFSHRKRWHILIVILIVILILIVIQRYYKLNCTHAPPHRKRIRAHAVIQNCINLKKRKITP